MYGLIVGEREGLVIEYFYIVVFNNELIRFICEVLVNFVEEIYLYWS